MATHFVRGKYRDEDRVIEPSLTAIENAYDFLIALPDRDSVRFHRVESTRVAADSGDVEEVHRHLSSDAFNWLKFFWWTTAFKARQLTSSLIEAYNTDHFLPWVVMGRASLEYAAVTYYFVKQIRQCEIDGPVLSASSLHTFEELLLRYAHGSRFNWDDLMSGNREGLTKRFTPDEARSAINVLTALEHLSKRDNRYRDVKIGYEMLSDFAHPNMASHATVIQMPTGGGDLHEGEIALAPGALRGEFLMVVSLPWVSTGLGTTVELLFELAPLLQRWLSYVDGDTPLTINITA